MAETILIVGDIGQEDLQTSATLLRTLLPEYEIKAVSREQSASELTARERFCMTLVMYVSPGQQAQMLHTIIKLHDFDARLPVIVWVPYGEEAFAKDAIKAGAYDFITRPVATEKLVLTIKHACDIRRMRSYVARLEQHIAEQIDISPQEREAIMMNQMHQLLVDENGRLKPLKAMEKEIIMAALGYSNGCVSRAARSLGIGRSTLYRKVGEYNMQGYMKREIQTTLPAISMLANERVSGK